MFEKAKEEQPKNEVIGVWLNGLDTKQEKLEYKYMSLTVSSADSINKYRNEAYAMKIEQTADSLYLSCKSKI